MNHAAIASAGQAALLAGRASSVCPSSLLEALAPATVLDAGGTIVAANAAWGHLLRRLSPARSEPGVGQNYFAAIGWGDCDQATLAALRAVLQGERSESAGEVAVGGPERPQWLAVRASYFVADGQRYGLILHEDITERKRWEQNHRNLLALYHSLVENLPQSICRKNPEGRLTFANQRFCQSLGKSLEELLGRTDDDLYPPELARHHRTEDRLVMKTGQSRESVVEQTGPDGLKYYTQMVKTPLLDAEGRIIGVQGILWDNTTQKRAEERVRAQAELLDLASDAILVRDLEDRIQYWNRGAQKLYGWTAAETRDRVATELLGTDGKDFAAAKAHLLEQNFWSGEFRHKTREGREVVVASRWTLVRDADAQPRSVLVIDTDITEKKHWEAQSLRSQRLESLGQLAGGIAHDLNNILAPIMMGISILRETIRDGEAVATLDTMEASASRGAEIVNQILTFARGMKGDRVPLQVHQIFKEIENIIRETFPKSITLQMSVPQRLHPVHGNATQLHQVLINLCVNARDAMPDGGVLSLSARNVVLDEAAARRIPNATPGAYVAWHIADTGVGIPPENLDRIFDPFFTTKEIGKGTGLGLSTVVGLVRHHEGFLEVSSEVGKGTEFTVYLPAVASAPEATPASEEQPYRGNGELILIVEDELVVRMMLQSILQRHGYRCLTAADGKEGVRLFQEHAHEIAAVATDLMMPQMDGVELVRQLRAQAPDLKVLICSGFGEDQMHEELRQFQGCHVLPKPYNSTKFLEALHHLLTSQT